MSEERSPAELAASGPRAQGRQEPVRAAVQAVADGYARHYADAGPDADLALLDGDRLYAGGLAGLADLGDLPAIVELADVISLAAQAHASGDPELARAAWRAGAAAVGWGATPETVGAKARARGGDPGAAAALRDAAHATAGAGPR